MQDTGIYAKPKVVSDVGECYFYHTMDIPGHGEVTGEWDLRGGVDSYLGGVDFRGKRVLELGTASGFLCFEMEKRGAEVVSYDLAEDGEWDIVPYAGQDYAAMDVARKEHIRKTNNSYWFSHRAFRSKARMVHGSVYAVPEQIGPVDVSVFGSILLHLRDPFLALQNALRLTKERVVVTDLVPTLTYADRLLKVLRSIPGMEGLKASPSVSFLPDYRTGEPLMSWWRLSPEIIIEFIGVLGFEKEAVTFHKQEYQDCISDFYTVVGRRRG